MAACALSSNLSFNVAEGRFFVLFGPSSVGKTTTLRTIAGLVRPTAAASNCSARTVTHRADRRPRRVDGVPDPSRSIRISPSIRTSPIPCVEAEGREAEIDRRVKETAAMLRLDQKLDRKPGTLVRRRAAARRPRPLADPAPEDPAARRAAHQPRRQAPPRHARRVQAPAPPVRPHHRLRDAGRARGAVDGRGNRRDARRRRGADRHAGRALRGARATSMWPARSARRP